METTEKTSSVSSWRRVKTFVVAVFFAAVLCVALLAVHLRSRPVNLVEHTHELAQIAEMRLSDLGIPPYALSKGEARRETDRNAIWLFQEMDVRLPAEIDADALIRTLRRDFSPRGVLVATGAEPSKDPRRVELVFAGRPFLTLRLSTTAAAGDAPAVRDLTAPCERIHIEVRDLLVQSHVEIADEEASLAETQEMDGHKISRRRLSARLPEGMTIDEVASLIESAMQGREAAVRIVAPQESDGGSVIVAYAGFDCLCVTFNPPLSLAPPPTAPDSVGAVPCESASADNGNSGELPLDSVDLDPENHIMLQETREAAANGPPRVAIIVDDGGYGGSTTEKILGLDPALTLAILPYLRCSKETAEEAARLGFQVLLHMPMETFTEKTTFPGSVRTNMTADELRESLARALADGPGATGLNNHTGAKFTQDEDALTLLFTALKDSDLFFVDSRTTGKSRAHEVAASQGIRARPRDLFLDNSSNGQVIREQVNNLIALARTRGSAIGICHFRPCTADALATLIPEIRAAGVELVHVSELIP